MRHKRSSIPHSKFHIAVKGRSFDITHSKFRIPVRSSDSAAAVDPKSAAKSAGLRYVDDQRPGITRIRQGRGVVYRGPDGGTIRDGETLTRIRSLAVPPAWRDVWICPDHAGHLQATGRDARGRKQYRYHPRWREVRDGNKYERMIAFGRALPLIRKRIEKDLARPGLPREKILATVVRLLEVTLIRVGNEEYAKQNESFGLATMRDRHVRVNGSALRFQFRGKSGILHEVDLEDRRLARIVRQSRDLPGFELFQYVDAGGERRAIDAADVNSYLKSIAGDEFTAKDFRTWAGTVLAARALREVAAFGSQAQAKRNVVRAVEAVAKRLGNTTAVCRKCYIHPEVVHAYLDGTLATALNRRAGRELRSNLRNLSSEEAAVLALLQRGLQHDARLAAA
jgi:DNA topoisomerase-1